MATRKPTNVRTAKRPAKVRGRTTMDRGVQAALENKYDAIVDLELALRAKLTGTSADDQITPILDLLENEAKAINSVLDAGDAPSISSVGPADAAALQNAINNAEVTIKQSGSVQSLLSAAAVLVGTIKQSKPA
jgi:hypothetical protein